MGRVPLLNVYDSTLSKIASLDRVAAEGARIRSRTRWAEEGEASTSNFFRLEKKNVVEEWFSAMRKSDCSIAADVPSICDSWISFYSDLFRAFPTNIDVQNRLLDNLSSSVLPSGLSLVWPKGNLRARMVFRPNFTLLFGMSWVLTLSSFLMLPSTPVFFRSLNGVRSSPSFLKRGIVFCIKIGVPLVFSIWITKFVLEQSLAGF